MPDHHDGRRKLGKRASATAAASGDQEGPLAPCGACKFLRRKCTNGCIFAPHFGSDQGAARFAAVHKVFGASNVSKLLLHIPMNRRQDAVVTISYEAQARLSDPVYGCVSTILALQQQVATLQAELAMVQSQVINSRLAMANALQTSQQQLGNGYEVMHLPHNHHVHHQPAYSNNSSASNNLLNMNTSATTTGHVSSTYNNDFSAVADASTAPSPHSLDLLRLSRPSQDDDEDDEQISRNHIAFANHLIHRFNII
uniref:LOB domain-containing protein n=2 Tax=Chenopodium quinoa TaxID=63459 RepID=A0A803N0F5_CHEQI